MIRRPPRSTQSRSSAASDVYKRQKQKMKVLIAIFFLVAAFSSVSAGGLNRQCVTEDKAFSMRYDYYLADKQMIYERRQQTYYYPLDVDSGDRFHIQFNLCYNMVLHGIQYKPELLVRAKIGQLTELVGYVKDQDPSFEYQKNGVKLIYDIEPVNQGVFQKLEIELQCDRDMDYNLHDVRPYSRNAYLDDKKISMVFRTKSGCGTFVEKAFPRAIEETKWLFFFVYLALGIFYCFFGSKYIKITTFVSGFILVSTIVFRLSILIAGVHAPTVSIWLLAFLSLVLGAVGGFIATKMISFAVILLGIVTGLAVGSLLGQLFAVIFASGVTNVLTIIVLIAGLIVGAYGGYKYKNDMIIFGTGIDGAYLIILALGTVIGGLPTQEEMAARAQGHQGSSIGQLLGYFFGTIVLAIAGIFFQYKYQKAVSDVEGNQPDIYSEM
eukprot:TRINITY_DN337_c0_g1_i12.p1 TRINITY_DN337_c0_g1~~TRINITY_DN337_c0_g1_i12.p1  ORF type:complete len:438 (+),score=99.48 TRINITY_DN337_c0_g1_i12:78-1391(+)